MKYKKQKHFEIERKFLIPMPSDKFLNSCKKAEIIQTYLSRRRRWSRRVRRWTQDGKTTYIRTFKFRITNIRRIEDEKEITKEEYDSLLLQREKDSHSIIKTRYFYEYEGHTLEIDVFPFWKDVAVMEIELTNEKEEIKIPEFLKVIKEVTDDPKYKNLYISRYLA